MIGRLGPPSRSSSSLPRRSPPPEPCWTGSWPKTTSPACRSSRSSTQRLAERRGDGFRYEDMPEDPEAWRQSIAALDADAESDSDGPSAQLDTESRRDIIEEVRLCKGRGMGCRPARLFALWMRYACSAFYAHPWAWNEIGFGGPAYPRGYKYLGLGAREPWEVAGARRRGPGPVGRAGRGGQADAAEGLPRHDRRLAQDRPGRMRCTMNGVRRRNESAWLLPNDGSRTNHQLRRDMRRFDHDDEVDIVIVGCGAGGGVLAQRLARQGWEVVAFDAGPFWDPDQDWVSDEAGSHQLYWNEPRVISGSHPVDARQQQLGAGRRRLHGAFRRLCAPLPSVRFPHHSRTTVSGADWPIEYRDLKAYYELLEAELPVAGQNWPWGDPHRYPHSPHPMGANGQAFSTGRAGASGIDVRVGPVAIANGRFGNRSHCIYRGFCLQGCKVNAKASPLITHVPDALAHGAEIRPDCMVSRVEIDEHAPGDRGRLLPRRDASIASEPGWWRWRATPSRRPACCSTRPARSSPTVCATTSTRSAATSWCRAHPRRPGATTKRSGPTRPHRPNAPPRPSTRLIRRRATSGASRCSASRRCRSSSPSMCAHRDTGERRSANTCVTPCTGRPSARSASSSPCPRTASPWPTRLIGMAYPWPTSPTRCATTTEALVEAATKVMEEMHRAAGAAEAITINREAHLIGGCRMSVADRDGVVDANLRSFAVPNLFIVDGSVCPTQGSANPALTIMALAARAADHLSSANRGWAG